MSLHYDVQPLRRLCSRLYTDAERFQSFGASSSSSSSQSTAVFPHALPDTLVLPSPPPITSKLVSAGVVQEIATRTSYLMTNALENFKTTCQVDFQRKLPLFRSRIHLVQDPKFASSIVLAYRSIYKGAVKRYASYLLDEVAPRLVRAQELRGSTLSKPRAKKAFNQGAVPILERFFAHNAFPSRLEKFELASQCDMEYRQIHVWFQNRRSRLRKEGQQLAKPAPTDPVLDFLETSVMELLLPVSPEDETDGEESSSERECHTSKAITSSFYLDGPPHAFPSPYPPLCAHDPFPIAEGSRCFRTPWIRSGRGECARTRDVVNISDLVAAMARLTISDNHDNPCPGLLQPPPRRMDHLPCEIGFTIRCPTAPHPSFVRRYTRSSRQPRSCPLNSPRQREHAGRRYTHCPQFARPAWPLPKAQNTKSTSTSPSGTALPQDARPKRSLPRRLPHHAPSRSPPSLTHGVSHALPTQSTALHDASRSSSSSSLCPSSPNHCGSDADSPLSTPPPLHAELPSSMPFHLFSDAFLDLASSKSFPFSDELMGDMTTLLTKGMTTPSQLPLTCIESIEYC